MKLVIIIIIIIIIIVGVIDYQYVQGVPEKKGPNFGATLDISMEHKICTMPLKKAEK